MTETTETTSKTVVDPERKAHYHKARAASGASSLNNGDPVAVALEGVDLTDLYTIGKKLLKEDFTQKYEHLNGGMQRMVMGNRIRAAVNSGDEFPALEDLTKLTDPIQARLQKTREAAAAKVAKEAAAKAEKKPAPKKKATARAAATK